MVSEGDDWKPYTAHPSEIYDGNTVIDYTGVTINNGALKVLNSNGTTTIDASKLMFRILSYGNGALTIPNGSQSAEIAIAHNLGYSPVFTGQFRYLLSNGTVETYSDSLNLFDWGTGVLTYNGRMWVTDTHLYISITRRAALASSGNQTIYYRYFIQEGVNL